MSNTKLEKLWIIGYGMSGGFGGIRNYEVIEADSEDEASKEAWGQACEMYESYSGSNGLRSVAEIMEEDGIEDKSEAEDAYNEEREGWIDYIAVPYSKEFEQKVSGNYYYNRFKEITDSAASPK